MSTQKTKQIKNQTDLNGECCITSLHGRTKKKTIELKCATFH